MKPCPCCRSDSYLWIYLDPAGTVVGCDHCLRWLEALEFAELEAEEEEA